MGSQHSSHAKIRVGIVGVGNCAASLVQGAHFYRDADPALKVPGLMHVNFGRYHVNDIKFVAAFDVDARKVGLDLSQAILASENKPSRSATSRSSTSRCSVGTPSTVSASTTAGRSTSPTTSRSTSSRCSSTRPSTPSSAICPSDRRTLRSSTHSTRSMQRSPSSTLPVFIAGTPEWAQKFEDAGVPIVVDDVKSHVGATSTHRVFTKLVEDRRVEVQRTYQLNVGGNMDFKNMLERDRLESKKISKARAVTSQIPDRDMGERSVHIGPSDNVAWLDDRKWAFVRLKGKTFGDVPLKLEYKLEIPGFTNLGQQHHPRIRPRRRSPRTVYRRSDPVGLVILHEVPACAVLGRHRARPSWRRSSPVTSSDKGAPTTRHQ